IRCDQRGSVLYYGKCPVGVGSSDRYHFRATLASTTRLTACPGLRGSALQPSDRLLRGCDWASSHDCARGRRAIPLGWAAPPRSTVRATTAPEICIARSPEPSTAREPGRRYSELPPAPHRRSHRL